MTLKRWNRTTQGYGTVYAGSVTGAGVVLPLANDDYPIAEVHLQYTATGQENARVGGALVQAYAMATGAVLTLPVGDLRLVYVAFPASGGTVNWIALG